MSTVQEIQNAISSLPEMERLNLLNWIHSNEESDIANDPALLQEAEEGVRQLDAGHGISLDEARKLASKWTRK